MENASKALIMGASVLLGVMILSIGVYIFSTFAQYSENAYQRLDDAQIAQFNNQFLQYYGNVNSTYIDEQTGKEKTVSESIKCTVHDIITIANLAQQSNTQYNLSGLDGYDESTFYVQVDVVDKTNKQNSATKLEKWDEKTKISFITEHSSEDYKCADIKISSATKRVCYVKFEKINK